MSESGQLDSRTFKRFAQLIYDIAGIKLGDNKEALVSARVGKRMRSLNINRFGDYYDFVANDETGEELVELLNAISTNVTSFYRERHHFDFMEKRLREFEARGQTSYRVWCAAASTGEEPYTLAMTLLSSVRNCRDIKILATDISTRALNIAKAGEYQERHMATVPERMKSKYFERERDGEQDGKVVYRYRARPELKRMITFARLNLSTPPFPMKGPFDFIFCRNVMIYFDNEVRRRLLNDCYRMLRDDGYLMVGHAESLSGILSDFKSVEPSVYTKR